MTKKEIALLAFKLLAAYAFIQAVGSFRMTGFFMGAPTSRSVLNAISMVLLVYGVPFMLGLVGWILWALAEKIAVKLFPTEDAAVPRGRSALETQLVAFRVLGMYVLVSAVPQLIRVLLYMAARAQNEMVALRLGIERTGELVALIVQLGLGVWLLYGAPSVKTILERVRAAGTEVNE